MEADRSEIAKFSAVVSTFPGIWDGKILDVGCRKGGLKRAVTSPTARYIGFDLSHPANVVGNLDEGLPFEPQSIDTVVALDVLEHTNDMHRCFEELCRVSRHNIVVSLPNIYDIESRVRFLLGLKISGKYGLPLSPPEDRHRWLFSYNEARLFCFHAAMIHGFTIKSEGCLIPRRRLRLLFSLGSSLRPNLFCRTYLVLLQRN